MKVELKSLSNEIIQAFQNSANQEEQLGMETYMKNHFRFLGIKRPQRDIIQASFKSRIQALDSKDFLALCQELWMQPEREFQYYCIDLLRGSQKKWNENYLFFFERMLVDKSWWDSVDHIASRLIGEYLRGKPALAESKMRAYSLDQNLWRRRCSIIYQLHYKKATNLSLLFEFIRNTKDDREFFIQKAIGWALRNISMQEAATVEEFIETENIQGLARREALRKIK